MKQRTPTSPSYALILTILLTSPVNLEAESPRDLAVFSDTATVNILNLDVYATTKNGQPVSGLGREDFSLEVDGEPTPISNFYAVKGRQPVRFIVYIDDLHLNRFSRRRHLKTLTPFLQDRIHKGDQVSVVAFDGSLRRIQDFTRKWPDIQKAFDRTKVHPSQSYAQQEIRQNALDFIETIASGLHTGTDCIFGSGGFVSTYSTAAYDLARKSADGLKEYIRMLAGLPDRRVLFFVSDGLPKSPGNIAQAILDNACKDIERQLTTGDRAGAHAPSDPSSSGGSDVGQGAHKRDHVVSNLAPRTRQASQYALDATPLFLKIIAEANAERLMFIGLRTLRFASVGANASKRRSSTRSITGISDDGLPSLTLMSEKTGGLTLFNAGKLPEQLKKFEGTLDTYYSLGFSVPVTEKHSEFRLDLKAHNPKLKVRYRRSIRVKSVDEVREDRLRAALLFGNSENNLGLRLQLGAAEPFDKRQQRIPFQAHIPLKEITLVPDGHEFSGSAFLHFASLSEEGNFSPITGKHIPIRLPADQLWSMRERSYTYSGQLLLRPGPQTLGICLQDEFAGTDSCITMNLF